MSTTNAVTWFEIGTDRPEEAERFYGEVFGWTFNELDWPGWSYRVTQGGTGEGGTGAGIGGAIYANPGTPNYAIFYVQVADVADACRQAEAAGGAVLVPPATTPSGLTFAQLTDPTGNHIGVFTPPAS